MIVLTAIIKNESKVAKRWLRSVEGKCAAWAISDTGSTDNTQEIVEHEAERQKTRLYFAHDPWVDFGTNRTANIHQAEQISGAKWMLILDADEKLVGDFPDLDDSKDVYEVQVRQGNTVWWSARLLRIGRGWCYEGAAHAYPSLAREASAGRIETVEIVHHADGGCKEGRRERNIKLLEKAVAENPDDARSWFYLAQEYRDIGDHKTACEMYAKRIELDGWDEERWNAMCFRGVLLEDDEEGIAQLEEAYRFRPTRLEALYAMMLRYRRLGEIEKSIAIGSVGMAFNSKPPDDRLFVNSWVYEKGLLKELGVSCGLLREKMLNAQLVED